MSTDMRRSPYGERGLKSVLRRRKRCCNGSLPVWGAWIEMALEASGSKDCPSLPVWGAWIEIPLLQPQKKRKRSLPVWGAWIEMRQASSDSVTAASLPVWGAWIEIVILFILALIRCRSPYGERGLKSRHVAPPVIRHCRSPYGERGLKFRGGDQDREGIVAPRMGSVD